MDRNHPRAGFGWALAAAIAGGLCLPGSGVQGREPPPPTPESLPFLLPLLESGRLSPERAALLLEGGIDQALEELLASPTTPTIGDCVDSTQLDRPSLPDSIDVLRYDIVLTDVDETSQLIAATTTLSILAMRDLPALDLDLIDQTITRLDARILPDTSWTTTPYVHDGRVVHVVPAEAVATGDTILVRIAYASTGDGCVNRYGIPSGVTFSTVGIHTFSEPSYARYWYPSHDVPRDRAVASLAIPPVPGRVASASGVLDAPLVLEGTTYTRWITPEPVATYLNAFYLGDYVTLADTSSGGVPLEYFVYPHLAELARVDFANIPDAMDFFSTFHPYPNPRYAMTLGYFGGGMEHLMNSLIGYFYMRGDRSSESLFVHELAHQWWGDYVTMESWRDIWLNEGFATYFDHLYTEHKYGREEMRRRIAVTDSVYKARPALDHAILDPPLQRLFSNTIYQKGARVLDMLRAVSRMRLMTGPAVSPETLADEIAEGDERFFGIFSEYARRHPWQNVSTSDFRAVAEEVLGEDLGWFFTPWLEGTAYPTWQVDWDATPQTGRTVVEVQLRQRSDDSTRFETLLPIRYRSGEGVLEEVRWISGDLNTWIVDLPAGDWTVEIDPESWILGETEASSLIPGDRKLQVVTANPSPGGFTLTASQTGQTPASGLFTVHDLQGREVRRLEFGLLSPGPLAFRWDGRASDGSEVASGVYFGRLQLGSVQSVARMVVVR